MKTNPFVALLNRLFIWLAGLSKPMPNETVAEIEPRRTLAWGNKVSAEFRRLVFEIADAYGVNPHYIMAVIAWETAETFRPDIKNMAGSGATGLLQFMPKTAIGLGTTVQALAAMSAEEQLVFVRLYFKPYAGRMRTLSDTYMAVLWPAGIGKPENWVLWDKATRPTTYRQNAGLDLNANGIIKKSEAAARVQAAFERGMTPEYLWVEHD